MGSLTRLTAAICLIFFVSLISCKVRLPEPEEVTIPAPSLNGNKLGDFAEQDALVFLPPSYHHTGKRYPVLYFLPGFGEYTYDYLNKTNFNFSMTEILQELYNKKQINKIILVILNGRNKLGGSFYQNSIVTGNWETYVVQDAVTFIDTTYRTIAHPDSRGIAGHSMGGFGSLDIALKHPDIYSCVYGMSPALFDDNGVENAIRQWQSIPEWGQYVIQAYGAAFSPDLSLPYPFSGFPSDQGEIRDRWDKGLGRWDLKIEHYLSQSTRLKTISLITGKNDEYPWLVDGARVLNQLFQQNNITCNYTEDDGKHDDLVGERLKNFVLPAFSRDLKAE
jgi:enterochelin esterase-like enzyme